MIPTANNDALSKILRAVRGAFAEGPVEKIAIRHLRADGEEANANVLSGDKISGKGVTPEQIADQIMEDISDDSKMFSGIASYAILFFKPGEQGYSRRVAVQLRGKADKLAKDIETTEPANEKGLVALAMRSMNDMMNRLNQNQDMLMRFITSENARLAMENQRLSESHIQVLQVGQDLIDRKEERGIRIERQKKQDRIVERGVEQVMMLAGPFLSKILPANSPAGQAVSTDLMTVQLLSSLSPQQIDAIASTLLPDQRSAFVELYGALRTRYENVQITENAENVQITEKKDAGSSGASPNQETES